MTKLNPVHNPKLLSKLEYNSEREVIKTNNKSGYMRNYLCQISSSFINQNFSKEYEILEIGSGIGTVLKELIKKEPINITGVDNDKNHLEITRELIKAVNGQRKDKNLQLIHDSLPNLKKLKDNKYYSILCAQTLHFLKPEQFEKALARMYDLLEPKGTIYITVGSPYGSFFKGFAEVYKSRLLKKERYPGYMKDPSQYNPNGIQHHPGFFNFFDHKVLKERFSEFGFKVIDSFIFDDGNSVDDQTGLIAIK